MPILKTTKDEIIHRAVEVFHQRGYHATSMSDLAQACGLQKGSFYHHFSSKEELMREVLAVVNNYYDKKIFSFINNRELSPAQRLTQLWGEQRNRLTHTSGGCLFGNMALETANLQTDFRPQIMSFFKHWAESLTALFAEKYSLEQAQIYANQSVMMMEGAVMLARLYQNDDYLEQAFQFTLNLLS